MGLPSAYPSAERVVACMDPASGATPVLHAAARLAQEFHAVWYAVYVTTPWTSRQTSNSRCELSNNIRTAEQLGAVVVHAIAERPAVGLRAFAEREGATHVVFGRRNHRYRWRRSTAAELHETLSGRTLVAVELEDR
jgi:two-component system, OmpR family, sensor histidine kinase KdpD